MHATCFLVMPPANSPSRIGMKFPLCFSTAMLSTLSLHAVPSNNELQFPSETGTPAIGLWSARYAVDLKLCTLHKLFNQTIENTNASCYVISFISDPHG